MKKRAIILTFLGIMVLIFLGGCVNFLERIGVKEEITKEKEELIGPGGCIGSECEAYCQQNPEECREFCEQNTQTCAEMIPGGHERRPSDSGYGGPPPGIPLSVLIKGGPGGCRGPECGEVCKNDPGICTQWCNENPDVCAVMFGGAPQETPLEAPDTVITYAKTVNLIVDQVTDEEVIRAKGLGANMVTIWPTRLIKDDKFTFFPQKGGVGNLINTAHKNGFQVELRSSYGPGDEPVNLEEWRANALAHVAEYAQYAEEHNVYRIVPFGEIDNNLFEHQDKMTEISQELLQEARKHYSGKIGIGIAAPWRDLGYTFKGYDYMTVSIYPKSDRTAEEYVTLYKSQGFDLRLSAEGSLDYARKIADRSNIQHLHIGETGVYNSGEQQYQPDFETVIISKEKEADYFRKLLEIASDKADGFSVFYGSPAMSVEDEPGEEVVKEWYNKLGNS